MNKTNEIKKIEKNYELIKFEDGDFTLDVNVSPSEDTVWLTQAQIAELYAVDRSRITRHINNILNDDELPVSVCAENAQTASDGKKYIMKFYNLDMILAVGYRVNSKRGIIFRRWASSILKQYLMKGYVINETRCVAHSDNLIQINNTINNLKK
ncbi:MAG: virulence RhuM family protein [Acholeplasmatales bacterium]|nr:virulence RhuM family protein [Acholeplasmatales bacterium]